MDTRAAWTFLMHEGTSHRDPAGATLQNGQFCELRLRSTWSPATVPNGGSVRATEIEHRAQ